MRLPAIRARPRQGALSVAALCRIGILRIRIEGAIAAVTSMPVVSSIASRTLATARRAKPI
jgi:hypothetical protein